MTMLAVAATVLLAACVAGIMLARQWFALITVAGASMEPTLRRIADTLHQEKPPAWRDLRTPTGGLYPVVWLGLGLAISQQFVGIAVIFFYSRVLWEAVGFGESSAFTIALVTSIVNVAITLVAIVLIDRVGRRRLLLFGSTGMASMLATLTVVFGHAPVIDGRPLSNTAGAVLHWHATTTLDFATGYSYTRATRANGISSVAQYHQFNLSEYYSLSKRTGLYALQGYQRAHGHSAPREKPCRCGSNLSGRRDENHLGHLSVW